MNTKRLPAAFRVTALLCGFIAASAHAADASRYIQDGLVACWDGIENAGPGSHNPSATVWKDLVAGREFALTSVTVDDDRMTFAGATTSYGTLSADDTAATFGKSTDGTLEIVYASRDGATSQILLQSSTASGIAFGFTKTALYLCNASAPTATFTSGTATNCVSVRYAAGKTVSTLPVFVNGASATMGGNQSWSGAGTTTVIGRRTSGTTPFSGSIYCIRLYNRQLTSAEIAQNHSIDAIRFKGDATAITPIETALNETDRRADDVPVTTAAFSPDFTTRWLPGTSGNITFSAASDTIPLANSVFRRARITGGTLYEVLFEQEGGTTQIVDTITSRSIVFEKTGRLLRMVWDVVYEDIPDSAATILHVTPEGAGAKNGADWANAFDSLQDAVNAASNTPARCVIRMKAGTYALEEQVQIRSFAQPLTIRGGYAGTGDTLSDEGTVLKRLTTPTKGRALVIANCPGVTLERLAVTGCSVTPVTSGSTSGLAIYSSNTELAFRKCAVTNNSIYVTTKHTYNGGGLYISGGSLTIEDSLFAGNSVGGAADGVSCLGGAFHATGVTKLMLRNSTFSDNRVRAHYITNKGGALSLTSIAEATITNCLFTGNWVQKSNNYGGRDNGYGGCICASSVTSLRITDCRFERNGNNSRPGSTWSYGGRGGTIYISGGSTLIERSIFVQNGLRTSSATTLDSGSIYLASGSLTLRNVLQTGCPYGHGIELGGGTMIAENCTFANLGTGAGYYQISASAAATFRNCIFANNGAGAFGLTAGSDPSFSYCSSESLLAGFGNIEAEALLSDATYCHPKSEAGHYAGGWFSGGAWTVGDETSPTIDAGDPTDAWSNEPQPNRHVANIGYDANTTVASKSVLGSSPLVDPAILKIFAYPVTDLGSDSATAIAEVASTGGGADPTITIVWDSEDRGTSNEALWMNASPLGEAAPWTLITYGLEGLSGNVTYRFVAENERGKAWSDPVSFSLASAPSATLDSVIRITRHAATVRATLVSDGGVDTTAKVVVSRADGTGTPIEVICADGNAIASDTAFEVLVEGLDADTDYIFSFVAENSAGTSSPSVTRATLSTDPVVRYVTPTGAGLRDGSSWENAYQLQDAFVECLYAGDEARLLAGTYTDFGYNNPDDRSQSFLSGAAGLTVRGGYTGTGDTRGDAATILNRDTTALPSPRRRLTRVTSSSICFDSVVFTNGTLESGHGYGVNLTSSTAIFLNCRFERNRYSVLASANGGAIYASGGSLAVTNCVFKSNGMDLQGDNCNAYGGAIYATGARVSVADSTFAGNLAKAWYHNGNGGAIYLSGVTDADIIRCHFATNAAGTKAGYALVSYKSASGGAIACRPESNTARLAVEDCDFIGDYSCGQNEAGATFSNRGGALAAGGSKLTASVKRCSFIETGVPGASGYSYSQRYGGIAFAAGTLDITDCLIVGTDGSNAVHAVGGKLRLTNVTIADNLGNGIGIPFSSASVAVTNSIVWGNALDGIGGDYAANASVGYSLVQGEAVQPGTRNLLADPNFRPDPPWRLKALSPCVGAGLLLDGMRERLDLAGNPRVIGSAVDLGCYEMDTPPATYIMLQ